MDTHEIYRRHDDAQVTPCIIARMQKTAAAERRATGPLFGYGAWDGENTPTKAARVVARLREGPVTGPELAAEWEIQRTSVRNCVHAARKEGFDIVTDPETNEYRLVEQEV